MRAIRRAHPLPTSVLGGLIGSLLVAACAESAGLAVLHYDADFERSAARTGQPTHWVVPRGSVS